MKLARKLALAVVVVGSGYLGLKLLSAGVEALSSSNDDPKLLLDRVWVDSKPERMTDYVYVAYFSSYAPAGIFEQASMYDIHLEQFEYRRSDSKIDMVFPQSSKQASFSFTVKACDALPPFDLCLDLSENPWAKPKRYYGMRNQEEEGEALGALAKKVRAQVEVEAR